MKITKNTLLILLLSLCASSLYAAEKTTGKYLNWATTIADSEIKHRPELWQADFVKKPKWDYTQGLVAKSMLMLFAQTGDSAYYNYVKTFADFFVDSDGNILTYKMSDYSLDRVNGGKFLIDMYHYTKEEKYLKAVQILRKQFDTQPRTHIGVFWHKKIYPYQVWLDGLYMGAPFYAEYAKTFNENTDAVYADAVKQFVLADSVTLDKKTGLNFHAWEETRNQRWADPITGHSPHFWGRSMGWYMMAMADALEILPEGYPQRDKIQANFNRLTAALAKYQDKKTGMWYQVTDLAKRKGNYVESSCSAMFVYAIAKGVNKGFLPEKYRKLAITAFDGLTKNATQVNADGTTSITKACSVAGLGGNPYRDGSFEYYVGEPIRNDDPKVIGPFIMAALEMNKLITSK
ncbi:MAG: glycoside hydrolase family 88 protein [Prevotellaceae bacterium]|jgi:unsaturated rhamnogalacturonyl hydrolase|nr:glycoside hydrolase family 88 protein [Prevotellaceae bacterium]